MLCEDASNAFNSGTTIYCFLFLNADASPVSVLLQIDSPLGLAMYSLQQLVSNKYVTYIEIQ